MCAPQFYKSLVHIYLYSRFMQSRSHLQSHMIQLANLSDSRFGVNTRSKANKRPTGSQSIEVLYFRSASREFTRLSKNSGVSSCQFWLKLVTSLPRGADLWELGLTSCIWGISRRRGAEILLESFITRLSPLFCEHLLNSKQRPWAPLSN